MFHLLQFFLGHALLAAGFYSTHRWVLHGKLGLWPHLRALHLQHRRHHKKPRDPGGFLFTPGWNVALFFGLVLIALVSPAMGLGAATYLLLYAWRHRRSHEGASGTIADHHREHHFRNPQTNFDIVYPFIDKLMGTKRKSQS